VVKLKTKKRRGKYKNLKIITFLTIIILSFVLIFLITKEPKKSQILEKLKKFPEIQDYKNYPVNITFLLKDDLTELVKDYPVIYGNITKDVYEIKFLSDSRGLLVLYDSEENIIIRLFEIMGIKI